MGNNINAGLNRPAISRDSVFGVPGVDFTADNTTAKAYGFNQSFESPLNVIDTPEKTVVKSTFGSQIQKNSVVVLGNDNVNCNFGHQIGLNDFGVIAAMYFQNGYEFLPTIVDGSITAIVNNVNEVTLTLTDAGTLVADEIIQISGRTVNTDENGRYIVKSVTGNDIVIDFVGGFDSELVGAVIAELNNHKALIEDVTNCKRQNIDSSYSIYLPRKFEKNDCAIGAGEIYSGVVPKTLNVDFMAATYTSDTIGQYLNDETVNVPVSDAEYFPTANDDGYCRSNVAAVKVNGVTQAVSELTVDVELGTEDSNKVRLAGRLYKAVVDGVSVKGNWKMLFLTEDEANNFSNTLYKNRTSIHNEAICELGIDNTDGSSVFIKANYNFMNEQLTKEVGGWILSVDFEALRNDEQPNVELLLKNGYSTTMESLFKPLV